MTARRPSFSWRRTVTGFLSVATVAAAVVSGLACTPAQAPQAPPLSSTELERAEVAQRSLTPGALRARAEAYAEPRFEEGRPGTAGARLLADRLAADLRAAGCPEAPGDGRPAGDTPAVLWDVDRARTRLVVDSSPRGTTTLEYGEDFVLRAFGAAAPAGAAPERRVLSTDLRIEAGLPPGGPELEARIRWLDGMVVDLPGRTGPSVLFAPRALTVLGGMTGHLHLEASGRRAALPVVRVQTPGALREPVVRLRAVATPSWLAGGNGPLAGASDAALVVELMRVLCATPLRASIVAEIDFFPDGVGAAPTASASGPEEPARFDGLRVGSPQLQGWFASATPLLGLRWLDAGRAATARRDARALFARFGIGWREASPAPGEDAIGATPDHPDAGAMRDAYLRRVFATREDRTQPWYSWESGVRHAAATLAVLWALAR